MDITTNTNDRICYMDKQDKVKLHIVHGLTLQDLTDEDLWTLHNQLMEEGEPNNLELGLVEEELCSRV